MKHLCLRVSVRDKFQWNAGSTARTKGDGTGADAVGSERRAECVRVRVSSGPGGDLPDGACRKAQERSPLAHRTAELQSPEAADVGTERCLRGKREAGFCTGA